MALKYRRQWLVEEGRRRDGGVELGLMFSSETVLKEELKGELQNAAIEIQRVDWIVS